VSATQRDRLSELSYTLVSDGSSDAGLIPILDWLLEANGVACAIQGVWADLRRLPRPPASLSTRIGTAVELFPCELLFVHRDAEREPYDSRRNEVREALAAATFGGIRQPVCVCVIPVRMREAWLLFDENAIRRAAGNPSGRVPLELPALRRCEELPDPKDLLNKLIVEASELGARRREKLPVSQMAHRVAEFIQDFRPLRGLSAFATLEREIQDAISANAWDRRR